MLQCGWKYLSCDLLKRKPSGPRPVLTLTVELTYLEVKAPFASPWKPLGWSQARPYMSLECQISRSRDANRFRNPLRHDYGIFWGEFWAINGHVRSRHGNTYVTFASYVCWKDTEVRGRFALTETTNMLRIRHGGSRVKGHEWSHLPCRPVDGFLSSPCATFSQSLSVNSPRWRTRDSDHVTQNTFAARNNEA